MLLKNIALRLISKGMTHYITRPALAAVFVFVANVAFADCTVEYKAKQDDPLRLEQAEMEVSGPCTVEAVTPKVEEELEAKGWTLLKVISVSKS